MTAVLPYFHQKIVDIGLLIKFKLSLTVVLSAVMSYWIAAGTSVSWSGLFAISLGGLLVTGSANALNQILEKEYDQLMTRTANRPLATGRMTDTEAMLLSILMAFFGISTLLLFNEMAALMGAISLVSYAFVYTPMKRWSSLAVAVGAIPGAMPVLIGVVAYTGKINLLAIVLFSVQFLWQFIHFWAIAWLSDEDYKRAGFQLLPSNDGKKDKNTGLLSFIFALMLVAVSIWGYQLGLTNIFATIFLVMLNLYWATACWKLYRMCSMEAARKQMFISFVHLPLTLLAFMFS